MNFIDRTNDRHFMTAINFDNALGIHASALEFRTARAQVLASNIANADTVGYKAQDLDFRDLLKSANQGVSNLQTTDDLHIASNGSVGMLQATESGESNAKAQFIAGQVAGFRTYFREPVQHAGLDGNTVDVQRESVEFAKNALDFSVSFRLLNGKFSGLTKAIKGE